MLIQGTQTMEDEKPTPKRCLTCDQEKNYLFVQPYKFAYNGDTFINTEAKKRDIWICLECLSETNLQYL